ncbi:porin family protein [Formosa sp. S-31]|uniref:porin family protein n=1 Tax=Formosa sp. S-31 TaxID=2790949 RepID=UPI003EBA3ED1
MKKQFLVLALSLIGISATAQSWSTKAQLGVKGGVNFATVKGDRFDSPDSRTSFNAGLILEAPLNEIISLQPEAFYSGQGFKIDEDYDAEYQVDYIQVPVLLKVYIVEGLNIQVGPQFGFKINEELDFEPTNDDGDINTNEIEDFDMQIATGLEYKFAQNFFIQGRYTYGFSELIKDYDVHSSVFSVGIGFMF